MLSFDEIVEKQEKEFRTKCEEIAYYQGNRQRITIDHEWTEEDLIGEVKDEVYKYIEAWKDKHKNKAMYNNNLVLDAYMAEEILNDNDVIEIYNKEYDKRRNEKKFGIVYFDDWLKKEVDKRLRQNLVLR